MARRFDALRSQLFPPRLDPVVDALWPDGVDIPSSERLWPPPELVAFAKVDNKVLALHVATPELPGALPGVVVTSWSGEPEFVGPLKKGLRAVASDGFGASDEVKERAGLAATLSESLKSGGTPGYGYVRAADGLTVRFPLRSWSRPDTSRWTAPEDATSQMERLLEAGRPGSALAIGRSALHLAVRNDDEPLARVLLTGLVPVYRALERDVLADIVEHRLAG